MCCSQGKVDMNCRTLAIATTKKTTTVTSTSILLTAGCVHHICYNLSYSVGNFEIIITPAITQQCYYKWQKIKRGNEMGSIAMQW